jgi:transcriptional regulator with GAF, ATPase, and Fis domain
VSQSAVPQGTATAPAPAATPLSPDELTALLRIHRAVASEGHHRTVLAAVAQVVSETLGAEALAVLPAGGPQSLELYPRAPEHDERDAQTALAPLLAYVIEAGERTRFDVDALGEHLAASRDHLARRGLRSALVMPFERDGALALFSRSPTAWTETSPALLDELAASVASALAACLSREALESRSREAAALLEVNRAIGRHLDRDELFGALARCLRDVVPTQRFGIELPTDAARAGTRADPPDRASRRRRRVRLGAAPRRLGGHRQPRRAA